MNQLRFELSHRPHPYPNWKPSELEAWAELIITITHGEQKEELFKLQWNMEELIEWYLDFHNKLCCESFPCVLPEESLAQAHDRLFDLMVVANPDDDDADKWSEILYSFRESHCLDYALRGVNMPSVVIGLNRDQGEISLHLDADSKWRDEENYADYFKPGDWAYPFDMADFQHHFKQEIRRFLEEWLKQSPPMFAENRANEWLKVVDRL